MKRGLSPWREKVTDTVHDLSGVVSLQVLDEPIEGVLKTRIALGDVFNFLYGVNYS